MTCEHIKMGVGSTDKSFRAGATADCKTSIVVFLIECQKCGKKYFKEMENPLHLRLNGHRSDYSSRLTDKPVGKHFNELGHKFSDLTIMINEQMGTGGAA